MCACWQRVKGGGVARLDDDVSRVDNLTELLEEGPPRSVVVWVGVGKVSGMLGGMGAVGVDTWEGGGRRSGGRTELVLAVPALCAGGLVVRIVVAALGCFTGDARDGGLI